MAEHRFLRAILTERAFARIRSGTKQWLAECPCGHRRDLWDAGRVRYKATGSPRERLWCPICQRATWHQLRKKTRDEVHEIP